MELRSRKHTKNRKDHKCSDCEQVTPAGGQMLTFTYKEGELFSTKKICLDCEKYYRVKDPEMK